MIFVLIVVGVLGIVWMMDVVEKFSICFSWCIDNFVVIDKNKIFLCVRFEKLIRVLVIVCGLIVRIMILGDVFSKFLVFVVKEMFLYLVMIFLSWFCGLGFVILIWWFCNILVCNYFFNRVVFIFFVLISKRCMLGESGVMFCLLF